jgi:dTDP-L-rhamnose 4-epimerase
LESQIHQGKKPDYLNPKAEFVLGDITNSNVWKKYLARVDAIIHLAAMTGIGQSMYQPSQYLSVNVVGTAKLYESLIHNDKARKKIKKIVIASSKTVYGEGSYECPTHDEIHPGPRSEKQMQNGDWEMHCPICDEHVRPIRIREGKPVQNLSVYALSKFATENLSVMYGKVLGIPTTVFRYFSAYGPRQSLNNPYTGVCSIFLCRMKNNKPPVVFEDGKQLRDFVFVKDIAEANLLALEKAEETNVYNIGTGVPTSIIGIARVIKEILGVDLEPVITREFRIGDTRHDSADISKAEREIGFRPKWKLKEGLEELVKWSETNEAKDKFEFAEQERKILRSKEVI